MKDVIDLGRNDCRFPIGDGPFLFCAEAKIAGSSYWAEHHAICWVKPIPFKDKAPVREMA